MSHKIVTDKEHLLTYWRDEQKAPNWYQWSNGLGLCNDETFFAFCDRHTIYEIGQTLIYVQWKSPTIVEIHCSVKRGSKVDVEGLQELREELFRQGADIIYGWVFRGNRPLKKLCQKLGLYWRGLTLDDPTDGKIIERHCFAVHRLEKGVLF